MEVWILLAAAGSGYLARRWQNAQRPKGSSADEAEGDNGARPSGHMPKHRGRYRRFSSSARRQIGKFVCDKGTPYWVRSKNVGSSYKTENEGMDGEGVSNASREGHVCNSDGNACEICAAARNLDSNPSHGPKKDDSENLSIEQALSDGLSSMRISSSHVGKLHCLTKDMQGSECGTQEEEDVKVYTTSPAVLFRSTSGKRANDTLDAKAQRAGQMHEEGYAGKRMKDATANPYPANPEEGSVFGSWMPGFWDVSEGVFVLDTDNLLGQQCRKGSSSSRKNRTPNKYGKSRSLRKRNLAGQKPMSSLESCLSAQLGEDFNKGTVQSRKLFGDPSFRISEKQAMSHAGSLVHEGKVGVSKPEPAIGLPSLSRQPSTKKAPSKSRTPNSLAGRGFSEEIFNPFASRMIKEGKFPHERFQDRKEKEGFSVEGLLFNFGVGVGMMFTVMSNMREVKRLTSLLKEAESLIKDLEDELERKVEMHAGPGLFKGKGDVEAESGLEHVTNTLRKVRSATESLCSMRMLLANEQGSSLQHAPSKDMSKLEAELEAELERMELSLGDGDAINYPGKNAGSCVLGGEVGDLVHGELTILGLPHEVEKDLEDDGSSSSQEDLHGQNYAVSPRLLAKRLQEVLEARQEERISELEMELNLLSTKLQAKEDEVRQLKDNSRGIFSGDLESLSSVEKKPHQNLHSRPCQKYFFGMEDLSIANEQAPQISVSHHASPVSPHIPSDDVSVYKKAKEKKSTAFITLGGEALAAYKEACDEFSKVSSDPVGPFAPVNRKSERQGKEVFAQGGKADAKQFGSADGWEQVDLLSLAEDFYVGGDPDLLENMPVVGRSSSMKERRGPPRRKSRNPEPEQAFSSLKGVDSSDDATNDTSVSTPCSVKFIDVRTVGYCGSEEQQKVEKGESNGSDLPSCGDWSQEFLIRAGVNTPTQEEYCCFPTESKHSSRQFPPCSKQGEWGVPDDSDYYSELDEQLGHLLIKRIVEKRRKGSPIVQDAQTVLASLEKNEPVVHAVD